MRMDELQNLIRIKKALAEKYERKVRTTRSKPRKAVYLRQAEQHRRQVEDLQRST
jgi:hypothetical protein